MSTKRPAWFDEALLKAQTTMMGTAMKFTGNKSRAEDLVQTTNLAALAKWDYFEPGTNLHAWLTVVMRNEWYTTLRRNYRTVEDPDGEHAAALIIPAEQEGYFYAGQVVDAINGLPDHFREALLLVMEQVPYEEAAQISGTNIGTMKSRISRARELLTKRLDPKPRGRR
jgi:RNA polymerase sigma-70 factor (ECF subfamily)